MLAEHREPDRGRQPRRLREAGLRVAVRARCFVPFRLDMQNQGTDARVRIACRALATMGVQAVSSAGASLS